MANYSLTDKQIQRFWAQVDRKDDNECWLWTGDRLQNRGYGRFGLNYKTIYSHRIAYFLAYGDIGEDMYICHHCDNPPCCNPSHLFIGTPKDNSQDRERKGRRKVVRGNAHPQMKVTTEQIEEIRRRYAQGGISQDALADEYGISQGQVWRIINNQRRTKA